MIKNIKATFDFQFLNIMPILSITQIIDKVLNWIRITIFAISVLWLHGSISYLLYCGLLGQWHHSSRQDQSRETEKPGQLCPVLFSRLSGQGGEKRMMAKLLAIMDNTFHPLQDILSSTFWWQTALSKVCERPIPQILCPCCHQTLESSSLLSADSDKCRLTCTIILYTLYIMLYYYY